MLLQSSTAGESRRYARRQRGGDHGTALTKVLDGAGARVRSLSTNGESREDAPQVLGVPCGCGPSA